MTLNDLSTFLSPIALREDCCRLPGHEIRSSIILSLTGTTCTSSPSNPHSGTYTHNNFRSHVAHTISLCVPSRIYCATGAVKRFSVLNRRSAVATSNFWQLCNHTWLCLTRKRTATPQRRQKRSTVQEVTCRRKLETADNAEADNCRRKKRVAEGTLKA